MKTAVKTALPCIAAGVLATASADAQINWTVTYDDVTTGTNVGFDDATYGAARQATVTSVLNYLDTILDHNGSAELNFNASETDGTGALASAGPLFFTGPNGFSNGLLFEHATTGTDPSAGNPDATLTFDFGYNWNSETDAVTFGEFDLATVLLHEISHTLGILSATTSSGASAISGGDPGVYSVFDSLLERGDGTALFASGGDFIGSAGDLTSDDVYFNGPSASAANGGSPVQVHAPGSFASGSSISHTDSSIPGVMNFSIASGVEIRSYNAVELGILEDIGWTVVPEPTSMLALGLGMLVVMHRRRG